MTMAQKMNNIYKDGDKQKCVRAMAEEQTRVNYCTANFSDDFVQYSDCKDTDEFCTFCCEAEFGEMLVEKRGACIKELCDGKHSNAIAATKGRWVWQTSLMNNKKDGNGNNGNTGNNGSNTPLPATNESSNKQ